ncbi:hypothetical protein QCA50_019699 [Cerrena zonata]|uniref:Pentatricopeptide repeat-containing protein n=1 Tax=Cerrena zonata TaxID=2478898 RepID=A0AAW0FA88_9APHY
MSTWVFTTPWSSLARLRVRLDFLQSSRIHPLLWSPILRSHYSALASEEEPPSMIAMRNEPYPREKPDSSIFEEHSPEYGRPSIVKPAEDVPTTSLEMLLQLVRDRNFDDAERLLSELNAVGVTPKPSFWYANVAVNIYRKVDGPQSERLKRFTTWWSLIPDASEDRDYDLKRMQGLLLGAPHIPDMPIAIRYGLIASAKGYAPQVWERTIPAVIRYCPPTVSARFLYEFRAAHFQYCRKVGEPVEETTFTEDEKAWFSLAVRSYGISGLIRPGLASLKRVPPPLAPEEAAAYGFLPSSDKVSLTSLGPAIDDLIRTTTAIAKLPRETTNWKSETQVVFEDKVPPADPSDFQNNFEHLKTAFQGKKLPRAPDVAQFIQQCAELGRPGELMLLRAIARSEGFQWKKRTSLWTLSEMLYYFYTGKYRGLILTYMRHFQAVGLPLKTGELRRRSPEDPTDYPNFKPFEPLPFSTLSRSLGFWPSRKQHALVWKVIVESTTSVPELEDLYLELLEYVKLSRGRPTLRDYNRKSWAAFRREPQEMFPQDANYIQPIPPPMLFDAAHFAPFLKMLARFKGSDRTFDILSDMHQLRIIPSIECITTLCSTLALEGSLDKLTMLLDRMESTDMIFRTYRQTKRKRTLNILAPPTVQTYTILIRYLMRQNYVEEAQKVAERLKTNLKYVSGTDDLTDEILKRLENTVRSQQEELDTQVIL